MKTMKTMKTSSDSSARVSLVESAGRMILGLKFRFMLAVAALCLAATSASALSTTLVIAEVYGGGGNAAATYQNDFVVLFNRGNTTVDVNGWSIQYASAAGSSWTVNTLANVSTLIPSGGYFLVRLASGGAVGAVLPTPDSIPSSQSNMSGTGGKVALVSSTTGLTGTCPAGGSIVDFVGYGTTPNCSETATTAAPSNTTSVQRGSGGCTETDNNSTDFATATPNPRNSSTAASPCGGGAAPSITSQPQSQGVFAGATATFTVVATGTGPLNYQWYKDNFATPLSNGGQIGGATTNTLGITNVAAGNVGDYFVVITNLSGSVTSSPVATLSVTNPVPILLSTPSSRTVLRGATVQLSVSAFAAPPISYQWRKTDVDISNGGNISGATSNVLTITGITSADAGDYTVVVTNLAGANTSAPPATITVVDSGTLAGWNFNTTFNTTTPASSHGVAATASLVGTTGFTNTGASGLGDLENQSILPNYAWGTTTYPTNGNVGNNKTAGAQFKVSTVGVRNLVVSYDQRSSASASKYSRLQYTTNGTTYWDYPVSSTLLQNTLYQSKSFSLIGFPNVNNNPNFGVRVVSEFESTAKYGATNNNNYVGNGSGYGTAGTLSYDIVNILAESITNANTVPTISSTADLIVLDTAATSNINFTITDAQTPVGSLTVSAVSAVTSVLASPSVINNGDGTATLTLAPQANQVGIAPILVTVTDADGDSATTWFYVTVNPSNLAPTITAIPQTNTLYNSSITLGFTVGDDNGVGPLTLAGYSTNQTLVPNANISFGGGGAIRTVTITPAANQIGVVPITILVNDNDGLNPKTAIANFTLMVRPSTNVVFVDLMDYPDGSITAQSGGLWQNHSGTVGQMDTLAGVLNIQADTESEDVNAFLIGQPYATNSGVVLYYSYDVTFTALPSVPGSYISHFKDINTGASSGFGGRVWASITNAAVGKFRLTAGNAEGTTNTTAQFPVDLDLNTKYRVVLKFDPLTGTNSTMWINPSSESSPNVVAQNVSTNLLQPNPINVVAMAFRQGTGAGTLTVDNVFVGKSFASVVPVLTINQFGANAVVSWDNAVLPLQAAPFVTGTYTNVPGATSPYTNSVTAPEKYFRLYNP